MDSHLSVFADGSCDAWRARSCRYDGASDAVIRRRGGALNVRRVVGTATLHSTPGSWTLDDGRRLSNPVWLTVRLLPLVMLPPERVEGATVAECSGCAAYRAAAPEYPGQRQQRGDRMHRAGGSDSSSPVIPILCRPLFRFEPGRHKPDHRSPFAESRRVLRRSGNRASATQVYSSVTRRPSLANGRMRRA